jgi:hypothetical protein
LRARAALNFLIALPHPPIILYECQKKGFTKSAYRKLLIRKDCFGLANGCRKKKKREQAREEEKVKENFQEFLVTWPQRTKLYRRESCAR